MKKLPNLEDLLKKGVHFGHKTSKKYPKADYYIHTKRNGIHIIDLQKTVEGLEKTLTFVDSVTKDNGVILFVGSKKQAKNIIKENATDCNMPYIIGRWLGGTFTNFENIVVLTRKLDKLEKGETDGSWDVYTKKEQVKFKKEMTKLQDNVGGIKNMKKLPNAIFVVDIKKEKTAVSEANKVGIPVIAMVDTNVNPELVQYPIPANDDAIKSIEVITRFLCDAIKENKSKIIQS